MARTPQQREEYNRRRREARLRDARQQACRHAAHELIAWEWGDGHVPAVTPEKVATAATAMYGGYRQLRDITVEEATEALITVLERKGLPVLLTSEEQAAATSSDAMVATYTA
ncbi:hypothetical protein ACH4LN_17920 [Streptomyces albus]|uniref:hypothetical protein n=1 Tax=Streptomyces TaxID=1883 RepID=UPI00034EA8C6|nr:hypothetical protein [Streptomyces sp. HPH0547]EPD94588.1 hypothetical protein HMPREF1486_03141 [Streptomyces sp. HPH0547]